MILERSLQILLEILIFINNISLLNSHINDVNFVETKTRFQNLFDYLLIKYLKKEIYDYDYGLMNDRERFKRILVILNFKINQLNENLIKNVLTKIFNSIKDLNN